MNATSSNRNAATHTRARYKRPFDLGLVAAALVLLLPVWVVLGAAIALAIRIEDGGPVLYRHRRLGRGGRPFEIVKFRSMVVGAEDRTGPVRAAWRDTRRTRVGRVLRRCHLDELPQVINVLAGEMSLVGPRPERPELAARIEREVPGFSRRLRVDPGIMGLFQARGHYHLHPRHKLRYDDLYIATMSPLAGSGAVRAVRAQGRAGGLAPGPEAAHEGPERCPIAARRARPIRTQAQAQARA